MTTSDARKRNTERNAGTLCDDSPRAMLDVTYTAPNTEPVKVTGELDSHELREWAGRLSVSGAVGPATVLYDAARSIEETGEVRPPVAVVDEQLWERDQVVVIDRTGAAWQYETDRDGAGRWVSGVRGVRVPRIGSLANFYGPLAVVFDPGATS